MQKAKLCVLLPTKNEKENIAYMVRQIRKMYKHDLIVSDDHSTDGTIEIARSLKVPLFLRKKPGYGEGIKESLVNAKKRGNTHLLIIDCDRTYSLKGIKTMFDCAIKGAEFVNGGRQISDIRIINRLPNWFHTTLVNVLYFGNLKDVNSGMKLFNIEKYLGKITASGPDSTVQTIIIALKNKFKIKECMFPYNDRFEDEKRGKSKIRYRDAITITWRIIKDRFTHNLFFYKEKL